MSGASPDKKLHVAVIGGGVIGVCSASLLLRQGFDVTIVEPDDIAGGSSFGNAGCLNPSSVVPMSMPGNLSKVPGWLWDPLGPLSIRWPYLPKIAPWLLEFLKAGKRDNVEQQAKALGGLLRDSPGAYLPLVENAGAGDLMRRDGHLMAYLSRADFEADAFAWQLREKNGIVYSVLENEALWEREPALSRTFKLGVLLPGNGHTVNPQRFVKALADAFVRDGGRVRRARVKGFELVDGKLAGLRTDDGFLATDRAVVAAGARSKQFAVQLGDAVPLDTERGYHVIISNPEAMPSLPIMDTSGKFVATPMETGLRLAGTVEFAGLEAAPDWRRARNLLKLGKRLFPGLQDSYPESRLSLWMGFRPSMPDSLPVIGYSRRTRDVVYAFGHGHVGMAAGATTGHLVADLTAGVTPRLPLEPFSPQRFG